MHALRALITKPGNTDSVLLRTWSDNLFYNPIYNDVVEVIKQSVGFIRKTNALLETKEYAGLLIEVVFDSYENYESYVNQPSTISLWEMVNLFAEEHGIVIERIDSNLISDLQIII